MDNWTFKVKREFQSINQSISFSYSKAASATNGMSAFWSIEV
jgi:hypothetical protein